MTFVSDVVRERDAARPRQGAAAARDLDWEREALAGRMARILGLNAANGRFQKSYAAAKQVVRAFRRPAFYEVSTRCNLFCEGCYYFENGSQIGREADPDLPTQEWRSFFEKERSRGVSMAYFVGAEPALRQDRLIAAAALFPHGNIGTNGTIRIDPAVSFRIGVSVWAGRDATDRKLRGAPAFRKALKLYQGDPRAIMLFTVTAWNIAEIPEVVALCRDHGVELTFNLYSPTHAFNDKLRNGASHDTAYFRTSTVTDAPSLSDADLARVCDVLDGAAADHPDTVIYSRNFNRWITAPGPRYSLDADGIARECGSRIGHHMPYYTTSLVSVGVKCATPDVDCRTCRMYSGGWSSRFVPKDSDVETEEAWAAWLETMQTLGRIFLMPDKRPSVA